MSMTDFTEEEIKPCLELNPKTNEVISVNHHSLAMKILEHLPMVTVVVVVQIPTLLCLLPITTFLDHIPTLIGNRLILYLNLSQLLQCQPNGRN